ncbi:glutathione S-transferase [Methylovulum psychrotolerans]|uniref:glutathione S-transferase n=1 Tax=Methylovulum psychrotolerans TaxID=1704499 RepID=UPI001BFEFCF6|nr:glutathione S-transferase [Methylovulum psychrotolerans]MBT9096801.1 glutathione S-transferase [Methylovulum psychrotolerans]
MSATLPILYSFRRCPYAMRARLALAYSGIRTELREVALKNKPPELLALSPKATVPVLHLPDGTVLEESLDIMYWALGQQDPANWLKPADPALIAQNDGEFKYFLDRYKYADRYPDYPMAHYRQQASVFLAVLDNRLQQHPQLSGTDFSLTDAAILPFVRQFAAVDPHWFQHSGYTALQQWLDNFLASEHFHTIMRKYPDWTAASEPQLFP